MNDVLEAWNLCKSFGSDKQRLEVLKGLNLRIGKGEKVAIMGASGSGKSTLLHILGTLDRANEGELLLFEKKPPFHSDRLLSRFRNEKIGFVFQFHHLMPEFNALENVMMPSLVADLSMKDSKAQAEKILLEVGLQDRMTHRPGELSGGEQQRVALARALVRNPSLLLADEPTGNLDRENGEMIYDLLHSMNETYGITILMATHNEELARRMNRFLTMEDGKLIEERE